MYARNEHQDTVGDRSIFRTMNIRCSFADESLRMSRQTVHFTDMLGHWHSK